MSKSNSLSQFTQNVQNAFHNNDFYYSKDSYSEFGDFEGSDSSTYQLTENGIVDNEDYEPRALVFSFSELQSDFEDYMERNPEKANCEFSDQLDHFFYDDFIL